MKKSLALFLGLMFVLLCGCSSEVTDKKTQTDSEKSEAIYISPDYVNAAKSENVLKNVSQMDFSGADISDFESTFKNSDAVAIVRIDSILGGGNYSELNKCETMVYTYGKMTVLEVYKGNIKAGDDLTYYRSGGIMKFDEYYKNLPQPIKDKYDYGFEQGNKKPEYVESIYSDDISIEAGETYLVYLTEDDWISGAENAYDIGSLQGGMMKVNNQSKSRTAFGATEMKVLNNFTGEWEKISDIIP
ncbi:MAG: hypothetical protein ACI4JR_07985 [Acutalibacteraceae bacterium]